MGTQRFFGREVEIVIDGGIRFPGHELEFSVEQKLSPQPNKGEFKVYNLPPDQRHYIQKEASTIELNAGYGLAKTRLFKGDIRWAPSTLVGADYVTVIQAGEGERSYRNAHVNQTFSAGMTLESVLRALVDTFDDVGEGNLATVGFTEALEGGKTFNGPSAKAMEDLLKAHQYGFSIIGDQFVFVRDGVATSESAVVLDPSSGLIGTPEMAEKKDTGGTKKERAATSPGTNMKSYVKLKCLLNGLVKPGRALVVDSGIVGGIKGSFVAESVGHKGSNFSNDYYTDVEAFAQ